MTARGIEYAEQTLGVHEAYEQAMLAKVRLTDLLSERALAKSQRRAIERTMMDREMALTAEHRGKHPDHSEAAFSRHIKQVLHDDTDMRDARQALDLSSNSLEGLDGDIRGEELNVQIWTARMTELAGYLNYLAALKTAKP